MFKALLYQAHIWDPRPVFPILFDFFFLHSFGFVDVGRPIWREVASVLFSFCRLSPAQPVGLVSMFYRLYFWDQPGGPASYNGELKAQTLLNFMLP
jgi:hypothetical protein